MACQGVTPLPLIGCCGGTQGIVDETVRVWGWPFPCIPNPNVAGDCIGAYHEDPLLEGKTLECVRLAYERMLAEPWPGPGNGTVIRLTDRPFRSDDDGALTVICSEDSSFHWGRGRGGFLGWERPPPLCESQNGFGSWPPPLIVAMKWRVHLQLGDSLACTKASHVHELNTQELIQGTPTVTILAATNLIEMIPDGGNIECPLTSLNNLGLRRDYNVVQGAFQSEPLQAVCTFP
jgi:hypothetical protein